MIQKDEEKRDGINNDKKSIQPFGEGIPILNSRVTEGRIVNTLTMRD